MPEAVIDIRGYVQATCLGDVDVIPSRARPQVAGVVMIRTIAGVKSSTPPRTGRERPSRAPSGWPIRVRRPSPSILLCRDGEYPAACQHDARSSGPIGVDIQVIRYG